MKKIIYYIVFSIFYSQLASAQEVLPKYITPTEQLKMDSYLSKFSQKQATNPPDFPVRTMAEWEEIKAITISWQGYTGVLTEIVREAVDEVEVIIFTSNELSVQNTLMSAGVNIDQVTCINQPTNSIWIRDYGQHTVYANDVGDQVLVDWIYNRPRPLDDQSPEEIAAYFNYELFTTTTGANQLVNTGGNFMSDGMGTAFASELILEENDGFGPYNSVSYPNLNEAEIDDIMNQFMGINNYIKMETLPYDGIHHIDMHMKLLNEETILIAEYPEGVADGPQIETNIQYIIDNFTTPYGNPYKIIRIPSPPSTSGAHPDSGGSYRTYTNSVFINNKVLVPFYRTEYDTIAQRIYEEALPGYEIIGIDCDDSGNNIISLGGAIHCITKAVGVDDPLLVNHAPIRNGDYVSNVTFEASAKHSSGIASMALYYRVLGSSYQVEAMTNLGDDVYACSIQGLPANETIQYYFKAVSNSGKVINRPIVAPQGGFEFKMNQTFPNGQLISINQGWNIISSFINPNQSIDDFFEPISNDIVIVKDNFGSAYLPEWEFNSIGDLNPLEGYFVKSTIDTVLNITGPYVFPGQNPIELSQGWSTVSYLRLDEVSAELIFAEIVSNSNLVIVKDHFGNAYLPDWDYNGIGSLKPGKGYQLKVTEPDELQYLPINESY